MPKLVLHLDNGLMSHLQALSRGGFYGTPEETAEYLIRSGIIEHLANENLRQLIVPHLPKRFRKAYPKMARIYEAVARKPRARPI